VPSPHTGWDALECGSYQGIKILEHSCWLAILSCSRFRNASKSSPSQSTPPARGRERGTSHQSVLRLIARDGWILIASTYLLTQIHHLIHIYILNKLPNLTVILTTSGRLFQIVGAATRKARDAVTVFTRCGTISKSELDERSVLVGLYEMSECSKYPSCRQFHER